VAGLVAGADPADVGGAAPWVGSVADPPWAGSVADPVAVGGAVGDWLFVGVLVGADLLFDALGVGLPGVVTVDVGMLAVVTPSVGELLAIDVALQPAATPRMREAPSTVRATFRPRRFNRIPIGIIPP
jgi:hypothetical protein